MSLKTSNISKAMFDRIERWKAYMSRCLHLFHCEKTHNIFLQWDSCELRPSIQGFNAGKGEITDCMSREH